MLVLSNSLGTDLHMWDAQILAFTRHFQVLRYDTRGYGHSQVSEDPYSIEQLGRDMLALLDALDIQKASFCGLLMGGLTGQWLAINAPQRIERLVLCNTAAKIGTPEVWNPRIDTVRIPRSSGHPFHEHLTTDSTVIRPPIPRVSDH